MKLGPVVSRGWPVLAGAALVGGRYAADSLRHRRESGHGYALRGADLHVGSEAFLYAAEALTGAPISSGNDLELLINGDRIFPVFLDTIERARRSINLLTFVYWRGDIAHEVADRLSRRARDGVEVNVLLDAFGTAKMDSRLVRDMIDAGVHVARFRPLKPYAVARVNHRTHRKILVADGQVGMIGGVGIAEEWTGDAQDPDHWRDTHVRVRGPIVRGLQGAFAENWLEATGDVLVGEDYLPELPDADGAGPMQLVRSSAGVGDTDAEALFYLAIACASESIELTTAYFAPRPAFVEALVEAAERGVDVRLLVPGRHMDKPPVRIAGRAVYKSLLDAGVRVWEYGPTMLHAKTLVVDGAWSTVGSVNFDNRSFQLNDEATLCVQSESFAADLSAQFEKDLAVSDEITAEGWSDRPRRFRAYEQLAVRLRREL
ncbi:phospholipase D-like domain-containing protein [Pseudonocardia lacus]|uniref:phospholipase D-like domain-containing protein n=1 Tax=Pseudonocardia lacus TaxID=2835865 RepID=UPI001BDD5118|nr:phospholipase D-like domain-containing protein [Pseudonocardia lacus]